MARARDLVALLLHMFILQRTGSSAHTDEDCETIGICEEVDNYPTELVKSLIKELKSKNTIFNFDDVDINLSNRFLMTEQEICDFRVQQKYPRGARDNNGVMRFIINDEENPVQRFYTEICNTKDANCSEHIGFIPGYKGVCVQKTTLREMIYVDEKTNRSATGYFKVPTCCSCGLFLTI